VDIAKGEKQRMKAQFRIATPADAEVIAECCVAMALETENLRLDPATVRRGVEAVFQDQQKGFYLVAELEGAVAGQMMVTYEWSDWNNGMRWWIQSVYVRPPSRRRGVYSGLFHYLRKLARDNGAVCSMRLYVHRENRVAQAVYRKLEFEETQYLLYELDLH
jgi:ribosomal protein S18 acetylase RimI-like enzyme